MKTLKGCLILALFASLFTPIRAFGEGKADPNKYEVLAKALIPFVNLFSKKAPNPNRALEIKLRLEQMTGLPPALAGTQALVQMQLPDKLRISGPVLGEHLTICRNGEDLWVSPGAQAQALLNASHPSRKDDKFRLGEFRLPIGEKQLVFLPALFVIGDEGGQLLDGGECRVLDLQLMPELSKSLGIAGWSLVAWLNPKCQPARLIFKRADWELSVRIDEIRFAPSLPESTWTPTPEQAADVLKISPAQYQQLLRLVGDHME